MLLRERLLFIAKRNAMGFATIAKYYPFVLLTGREWVIGCYLFINTLPEWFC